ncbi:MAG: serine hydrolase [Cellulosilyticaceae bacterium]
MKKGSTIKKTVIFTMTLCLVILTIFPLNLLASPSQPQIQAESVILMDAKTGTILYEKNANKKQYPASITKLMTALLAIENLKPTDIISFSKDAIFSIERGSTHIGLDVGEQITVDQALHALLLMSANEVANGLAEKVSGSIDNFASLMTSRAKDLGAKNTQFMNPHGLPHENHYTTAYDMALITRQIYNNDYFLEIMSTPTYIIPPTNKSTESRPLSQDHPFMNKKRNSKLFREDVIGGKTGYTDIARHTLVTVARRNNIDLIVVMLKGEKSTIYQDTSTLLDYGFNSYKAMELHTPNDTLARLPIYSIQSGKLHEVGTAKISVPETKNIIVPNDLKRRELSTDVKLPEYLEIGVKEDEVIGSIKYIDSGKTLAESNLLISSIDFTPAPYKASYPSQSQSLATFYSLFWTIPLFIAFLFLLLIFVQYRKRNRFKHRKLKFSKTIK